MAMQSTGQGGTHKSQPVQSSGMTVCICFAAPTIASTGHACMQSVQPMQRFSSITASGRGRFDAVMRIERDDGLAEQRSESRDAFGAARRALVIVGLARRNGFGIGPARGIAAFGALRLGQQIFDLVCECLGCGMRSRVSVGAMQPSRITLDCEVPVASGFGTDRRARREPAAGSGACS